MATENKEKLKALYEKRKNELSQDKVQDALNECLDLIKLYAKDKIKLQSIADDLTEAYGFKISSTKVNEFIKKNRLVRVAKKKKVKEKIEDKLKNNEKQFKCPKCQAVLHRMKKTSTGELFFLCSNENCKTKFKWKEDGTPGEQFNF